jgi:hypothetical protein
VFLDGYDGYDGFTSAVVMGFEAEKPHVALSYEHDAVNTSQELQNTVDHNGVAILHMENLS